MELNLPRATFAAISIQLNLPSAPEIDKLDFQKPIEISEYRKRLLLSLPKDKQEYLETKEKENTKNVEQKQ